ncbi:hypothetical protein GCM10022252_15760 [Streptosporangium oxazolinicum]|uniref:VIT family protein n=1 Tax=Streptosporangium oxazolinicum TaxID=909287 RepID=A0ABP8AKC1_9ACTN
MRMRLALAEGRLLLSFVLGLTDGILNALVLATATILRGGHASIEVGLKVATVALVTAIFAVYVAQYSELRTQLARAGRQLNLTSRGRLATTHLGRAVIREALVATAVAGTASFSGSLLPLLAGALLPGPSWLPLAISLVVLGLLGAGIGSVVGGSPPRWSGALMIGGALVAALGYQLRIV